MLKATRIVEIAICTPIERVKFRYARYSLNYDIEKYAVHEIGCFTRV